MFEPATFRPTRERPGIWTEHESAANGLYRVADDSLALYELHVGVDDDPDLTAAPDATSATLPFTYALAAPVSGQTEYRVVVQQRNKYGLVTSSDGRSPTIVIIGDDGEQIANPPTAPIDVSATAEAGGVIRVSAFYQFHQDGDDRANQWKVYTKVGSDPVPGVDTPATVSIAHLSETAVLDTTVSGFSHGNVVHVLVTTYRTADTTESAASTVVQVTASASGPTTITHGSGLLGTKYQQG